MVSSDLSADLSLGILSPAASIRAVDRQSPHLEREAKARRRPRPEAEEDGDEDSITPDPSDHLPHQLDHLA